MAVGGGKGKTSAENLDRGGEAKQPEVGRRLREGAEQSTGQHGRGKQGQPVRLVPDH